MAHLELDDAESSALTAALSAGMSAIIFATDPVRWPEFAAMAEQNTQEPWGEAARRHMRADGLRLFRLAQALGL